MGSAREKNVFIVGRDRPNHNYTYRNVYIYIYICNVVLQPAVFTKSQRIRKEKEKTRSLVFFFLFSLRVPIACHEPYISKLNTHEP